jgi:hypothetical protein
MAGGEPRYVPLRLVPDAANPGEQGEGLRHTSLTMSHSAPMLSFGGRTTRFPLWSMPSSWRASLSHWPRSLEAGHGRATVGVQRAHSRDRPQHAAGAQREDGSELLVQEEGPRGSNARACFASKVRLPPLRPPTARIQPPLPPLAGCRHASVPDAPHHVRRRTRRAWCSAGRSWRRSRPSSATSRASSRSATR